MTRPSAAKVANYHRDKRVARLRGRMLNGWLAHRPAKVWPPLTSEDRRIGSALFERLAAGETVRIYGSDARHNDDDTRETN